MERQPFIMVVTGQKGVGKSYTTYHAEVKPYTQNDLKAGRKGRGVVIFDINGEDYYANEKTVNYDVTKEEAYTRGEPFRKLSELNRAGFPEVRKVIAFTKSRRPMTDKEMNTAAIDILSNYSFGMVVLEDTKTYIHNYRSSAIISKITRNRHLNLDIIIHLQSLALVSPALWENTNIIRFHYQTDDVVRYREKIPDFALVKIAQTIVNNRFESGDKRFFVYIDLENKKIIGNFKKEEFVVAADTYLNGYPDYKDILFAAGGKKDNQSIKKAKKEWIEMRMKWI